MTPTIELRAVEKSFGNIKIIRNITLSVAQGERHALIGPNGAGKSTTFNLISGYTKPTTGSVLLHGEVADPARQEQRNGHIGAPCHEAVRQPRHAGNKTRKEGDIAPLIAAIGPRHVTHIELCCAQAVAGAGSHAHGVGGKGIGSLKFNFHGPIQPLTAPIVKPRDR